MSVSSGATRLIAVEVGEGAVHAKPQVAPALAVVESVPLLHVKFACPVVGVVTSVHVWVAPFEMVTAAPKAGPLQVCPPTVHVRVVPEGITHFVLEQVLLVVTHEPFW